MIRRVSISLVAGCLITALVWLTAKLNLAALSPIGFLNTPGFLVAMLLSGWKVHDYSYEAVIFGDVSSMHFWSMAVCA